MSPRSSAALVSGPPASSGLKSLNVSPYLSTRPFSQKGRVGHSGGPPRMNSDAIGLPDVVDGLPPPDEPQALAISDSPSTPERIARKPQSLIRLPPSEVTWWGSGRSLRPPRSCRSAADGP